MAGKKKTSAVNTSSYSVIEWVIANWSAANEHISNGKDVSTYKCPTSSHAAALAMAVMDSKNLVKFIEQKQKMEIIRAKKTKANQLMADDQRRQFAFLDKVLSEMPISYTTEKISAG